MRRSSRTLASTLTTTAALVAMVAVPTAAAKDTASKRPSYDALPEGEIQAMAQHERPGAIPATEKAEGFHVEHPRHQPYIGDPGPQGPPDYASIYPTQAAADADYEGHHDQTREGEDAACLMTGHFGGTRNVDWNLSLQSYVNMTARMDHVPPEEIVQPVRSERVVRKPNGHAELTVRHAWIDPRTTGARLISSQTIPMRLVKSTMGLDVFAYRADGTVTFVAHRKASRPEHRFITGLAASTADGMMSHSTAECHASVTLRVAPRVAEAAVFDTEAVLPALEKNREAAADRREFRVRPMTLGISTSWTSSDAAPVLSIYSGWAGRERTQLF